MRMIAQPCAGDALNGWRICYVRADNCSTKRCRRPQISRTGDGRFAPNRRKATELDWRSRSLAPKRPPCLAVSAWARRDRPSPRLPGSRSPFTQPKCPSPF